MWFWPIIVGIVLFVAQLIYLTIVWGDTELGKLEKKQDKESFEYVSKCMVVLEGFFPHLKVMYRFSNIKASSLNKFVLFVIASIITHVMGGSSIPLWVFTIFTVVAFVLWRKRSQSYRKIFVKRDKDLMYPFYRAYRMLFFFQAALHLLLIFVL